MQRGRLSTENEINSLKKWSIPYRHARPLRSSRRGGGQCYSLSLLSLGRRKEQRLPFHKANAVQVE